MVEVLSMQDLRIMADGLNVDLDAIDLDSIELPAGQDFGIISDDDDLETVEDFEIETDFENIIVVDNLPVVEKEKYDKLVERVRKIYSQIGEIGEDGICMPVDPHSQKTLGYCFIEYDTRQEAKLAVEKTHGAKLGRSHVFSVNMLDDIDKFLKIPEDRAAPVPKPYSPGENLQKWLTDEKARDQFVIRAGFDTEVFWNDARLSKPEPIFTKPYWTESFVQWSPLGTYLATLHTKGAAVWGGASSFNQLMRYEHEQVNLIDFSPGERFLVTCSSHVPSNPRDTNRVVINIFNVRTRKIMRSFSGNADEFLTPGTGGVTMCWPVFRWSGGLEDKYFARIGKNAIYVYETDSFSLVDKKSIKVDNVVDFSWSPSDSILALFTPELNGGNQPAKVSLVEIPSKKEVRQKNLFSVNGCNMYWQSNGDYLAVKLDRYTKTRKSSYTSFELFRMKERDIPIEVLELDNKNDNIISFAWEPKGHRFAVIHGDEQRPDVSFYTMRSGSNTSRVSKLATLKSKQANALYWSPTGRFIILAGLKGFNGQLEFYDVDENETVAQVEHFMATEVNWDPSGRYCVTAVTSVHEMENGFNLWSYNGKLLYRIMKDHFFQFMWRPRPPSLLTPEKEEEIAKNLKKYSKKYKAEDEDVSMLLSKQDRERRKVLKEEWERWVSLWKRLHEEDELERRKLRDGEASDDDDDEYVAKQVEIEELLDVSQEVISFD